MATKRVLKSTDIFLYFKENESLLERGENSYLSGHVEKLAFDAELKVIRGVVKSSMKSKVYKVEVFAYSVLIAPIFCL